MEVEVNFEVYDGAAKVEGHNRTEPNQALQRINLFRAACPEQTRMMLDVRAGDTRYCDFG
jgi:hypothetical protein